MRLEIKINPIAKLLSDRKFKPKTVPDKKKQEELKRKKEVSYDYDSD